MAGWSLLVLFLSLAGDGSGTEGLQETATTMSSELCEIRSNASLSLYSQANHDLSNGSVDCSEVAMDIANNLSSSFALFREHFNEMAATVSRELYEIWSNASLSLYSQANHNLSNGSVEKVNGSMVAMDIANNLSSTFARFREGLTETAVFAEDLYSMFRNRNCCSSVCQYGTGYNEDLCSMSCNSSGIEYVSTGRGFGIGMETGENGTRQCVMGSWESDSCIVPDEDDLDIGTSVIHIPRDLHEEDADVLCFVQWSDQLSQQFASNIASLNQSLLTQYVGTTSRLLRVSPPFNWSALNQCNRCPLTIQDTFELGRRPWYTNTVAGEKFFIILLDVSGSMAGFQSLLARTTISQLLRALTPNDYFHILQVGEGDRNRSVGCFSDKTRATPENVLAAGEVVMSLSDRNNVGRAQFDQPLRDSLMLLDNSMECHRVLIIFSDGDRETKISTDLVRKHNKDNKIQVFSFLMGYVPDQANLKAVACQNRGRMGRIREYSDVIPAVLLITDSLTLPNSNQVQYTTYRDIRGHLALTMGLPIWSSNETFGIVGFDVPYQQLLDSALQGHRIGASGYAFIVDNTGQLVSHPAISLDFIQGLSDDSLLSLDLDYFENTTADPAQWAELRTKLLSGGHGQISVTSWALLERERFILRNTTYSYAEVEDTPYRVVVVTPADLWVAVDQQSSGSEVTFTQFSLLGGRGQCEGGWSQCEGVQRVEGVSRQADELRVLATGEMCGYQSVTLLRSLEVSGHAVGVVGHTLSPDVVSDILTRAVATEREEEMADEVYLLDETAHILSAYPHNQSGWFPAVYPGLARSVLGQVFEMRSLLLFEPRPREQGNSGVCEAGDLEEGVEREWVCESECESAELYVREVEVYQLQRSARAQLGEVACGQCSVGYLIEPVPNTTLTLVALSGSCIHGNNTCCARQPIRYRRLPCVCGSAAPFHSPHFNTKDHHNTTDHHISFCSTGSRPHPLPAISMATTILAFILTHIIS